ncbi:AraC family transcriptional regulator [Aquincola tertiaricarbonis]|uniref:AraC family transcriptional regulator n=1 Tax=Aquincola tertiaricarbonis TaxID=391953 RepID=UPI0009FB5ED4|nr:AraC family transcriptional regulator [Aquincola tertiaricarbonis]
MSSNNVTRPCLQRRDTAVEAVLRRAELAACIERHAPREGVFSTPIPRLSLIRVHRMDHPVHAVHEPALCLLAQGSKRVLLGGEAYVYDPATYLVVSQPLPVSGQVMNATPELPYLAIRLQYDTQELASLLSGMGRQGPSIVQGAYRGVMTADVTAPLLDAVLRLVRLLDSPQDIEPLAPPTIREILYRLLTGPCGHRLAQGALADSASHRVSRAIDWLRDHYREPLALDRMAEAAHLGLSALRTHFKSTTAMSPLQYQQHLRLQAARRLLVTGRLDPASAGRQVGYASASRFSRDYARMFGAAPAKDAARCRQGLHGALPHLGE